MIWILKKIPLSEEKFYLQKSRAFVNDVPVTLDVLKELSERLIDIHSQFETSQLFSEEYQFKIIDGLSENKNLIETYQSDYFEFQRKQRELEKLKNTLSEGNKENDYKLFCWRIRSSTIRNGKL